MQKGLRVLVPGEVKFQAPSFLIAQVQEFWGERIKLTVNLNTGKETICQVGGRGRSFRRLLLFV